MSIAILSTLIATTLVFAANARDRNRRGVKGGERGFPMLAQLNLTENQQKKVDTLAKKEREEVDKTLVEIDKLRDQIRAQWDKTPIDKNKVKSLHKKIQALRSKIADARLSFRLGVYDVLTPEQRRQAVAERKARQDRMAERRNRRGDGGYWNEGPLGDGYGRGNGRGNRHGRSDGRGPGFGPGAGMGPIW